jgi:hypothetical protein
MTEQSKSRYIVLPTSRILLIFIVAGLFIFRGLAATFDPSSYDVTTFSIYIIIGAFLTTFGLIAMVLRWRARRF